MSRIGKMEDVDGVTDSKSNSLVIATNNDDVDDDGFPENPHYTEYFIDLGISIPKNQHEDNMVRALKTMMDTNQLTQYKMYSESKFDFHIVRAIMHKISRHRVSDIAVFMVCELAKGYVEDIMNAALNHKRERKLEGPVTEDELMSVLFTSESKSFYLGEPSKQSEKKKKRKR